MKKKIIFSKIFPGGSGYINASKNNNLAYIKPAHYFKSGAVEITTSLL